jgi:hypothetical protein
MIKFEISDIVAFVRQQSNNAISQSQIDKAVVDIISSAALCYRDASGNNSNTPTEWPLPNGQFWSPGDRQSNLRDASALYKMAADVAEQAGEYERRDDLLEHVDSCAILLSSIM